MARSHRLYTQLRQYNRLARSYHIGLSHKVISAARRDV